MTLHEAIELVLKENNHPLSAKAIASIINSQNYYVREDGMPVEAKQVQARIKNYPSTFDIVNSQIVLVENRVWKRLLANFNYLKTLLAPGAYSTSDIQFILAVLLFYKRIFDLDRINDFRRMLPELNARGSSRIFFESESGLTSNLDLLEDYNLGPKGIFSECANLLSQLHRDRLSEVFMIVTELDTTDFDDDAFGDAFEYFLSMFPYEKSYNALTPTPYSLRQLMISILAPTSGSKVYDPVAGIGGLLIETFKYVQNGDVFLYGNEIIRRVAQLGNMNLFMHGIKDFKIDIQNSFYNLDTPQYDYIVADLPVLSKKSHVDQSYLYEMYGLRIPGFASGIGSFILLILSKLSGNGKAVITVSENFLGGKGNETEIRKLLILFDIVESVISLPFGTLKPYTEGKASLLVLNKDKASFLKGKIRFITANIADQEKGSINLDNEDILKAYRSEELLTKNGQTLELSELSSDFNLSAESYGEEYFILKHMLKEDKGRLLSDLVHIRGGVQPLKEDIDPIGDYPLVKIENLSKEILEKNLNQDILTKVRAERRYERAVIREECVLIARIGDRIKATIFRPSPENPAIMIHSGVYALTPINNSIDLEYLYYQFYSTIVIEQIRKRKLSAVMSSISTRSLKEIVIPYIDLPSQKNFIELQKANLITEEKQRADAVLKSLGSRDGIRQSETEIVKTLTHQLRPKLMQINSLAARVKRVVDKEGLNHIREYDFSDEDIDPEIEGQIQKPDNFSLEMIIEKMLTDSEHLSTVLSVIDKVMNFRLSDEDLSEANILDVIQEYKRGKDIAINGRFDIIVKGEAAIAKINLPAMIELLDQLLKNAEDHGFTEGTGKKYRVQFTVKNNRNKNLVTIDYNNNGAPYELEEKDFINAFGKGRKSKGSGIGGNYISRIVEGHRGKLNVEADYPKGFSLTIKLPIDKDIPYD